LKKDTRRVLFVRVDDALMKRLDVYVKTLRRDEPGPAWQRSDAVRRLLDRALQVESARVLPVTGS
jgi:hypothetical protein